MTEETNEDIETGQVEGLTENEDFNLFLTATKERFDKHFENLGYICFVFDKSNPQNHFMATISNVSRGFYLNKLIPFVTKYKEMLKKLNKDLNEKFKRIK